MGFVVFGIGIVAWAWWIRSEMDWEKEQEEYNLLMERLVAPSLAAGMARAREAMRALGRALS